MKTRPYLGGRESRNVDDVIHAFNLDNRLKKLPLKYKIETESITHFIVITVAKITCFLSEERIILL